MPTPRVLWGCFLDLINAIACIGTAVTLFPVVKRQQEAVALGFVIYLVVNGFKPSPILQLTR